MEKLHRLSLKVWLLLLFAAAASPFHPTKADALCTDLPSSTLQLFGVKAPTPEETSVSRDELDRYDQPENLGSRHAMMLSVSDFVAWFDISHRIIALGDGSVCDAPTLVRMGFGASRRLTFFVREAALDSCMRRHMRDHEVDHAGLFNDIVDRFIDQNRDLFQQGMIALKQMPAPNAETARARWEFGMRRIVEAAKRQLRAQIRAANARIDAFPGIEHLEQACGGNFR